jgi:diguanylate cyclase (GGDEF)-like protein
MFNSQGSEKIQDFVKQAASMHVVNTVYYISLLVLALFSQNISNESNSVSMDLWLHASAAILLLSSIFKITINFSEWLKDSIKTEQRELILTFLNVMATVTLVSSINESGLGGDILMLLSYILPALLFVFISPLTWNKKHREFVGIFGFIEWSMLFGVTFWSMLSIYMLFINGDYLGLTSNLIILVGPFLLKAVRKAQIETLIGKMYVEIYNDPLTGIKNRKAFYEYYDRVREGNKMSDFGFSGLMVIFVDIDHFKAYNDHYGHEMGDDCLREVASFLQNVTDERDGWEVFRYGGEEFLLVSPMNESDWEALRKDSLIEKWSKRELFLPRDHQASNFGKVTLSAGGCFVSTEDIYTMNAGMITKIADKKLYEAKEERAIILLDK